MNKENIRWKQRFANFERAFTLLKEGVSLGTNVPNIQKEGVIKRFEYTFELSWKVLKDYMEYGGIETNLPREVLKQAFANGLIKDGKVWFDMLEKRNLIVHNYDEKSFEIVFNLIVDKYFKSIQELHEYLAKKKLEA